MKNKDFERLKEICEKEGFELLNESTSENDKFYVVKKKDIWGGVEFVEVIENGVNVTKGEIFKVYDKIKTTYALFEYYRCTAKDQDGLFLSKEILNPSTEQAYIEQLKKEAFKRFGEIKEGEKFVRDWIQKRDQWPKIAEIDDTKREFEYNKEYDQLTFRGTCIYEKGKWAERVKERIEVEYTDDSWDDFEDYSEIGFVFKLPKLYDIKKGAGNFLAKQLEEYLNY